MTHTQTRITRLSNPQRELLAHWLDIPADKFSEVYSLERAEQLVAYVEKKPHGDLSEKSLRTFLKGALPAYMVPGAFSVLDQLPVLPNGKIDRNLLQRQGLNLKDRTACATKSLTSTEEGLSKLWALLFGLQEVKPDDDFFALGGNSLSATRLCAQIERRFPWPVSVQELFDYPTIALLANYIDTRPGGSRYQEIAAGEEPPGADSIPSVTAKTTKLSFQQRRLWFLDQWYADSTGTLNATYNMAVKVVFKGRLNQDCLENTLREIVKRHNMLKARFFMKEGAPYFWIDNEQKFKLNRRRHPGPAGDPEAQWLAHFISDRVNKPFDLVSGPPLRCDLVELDRDRSLLLISMHHIVSDGWSFGILLKDLAEIYGDLVLRNPLPSHSAKNQYADYIAWQEKYLTPKALKPHLDYWKKKLKDLPPLMELPTDFPRPVIQSHRGDVVKCRIQDPLGKRLGEFAHSNQATLFMVLLTGFKVLMARYTHQRDVVVGTASANRHAVEFENTIGFFANTLVLRSMLDENDSFTDALDKVRQTLLEAYSHQDVPFEMLVETLNPDRHLSHAPLFQVIFTMLPPLTRRASLPSLEMTTQDVYNATAKFDLIFAVEETAQGLNLELEYNTDLFEAATLQRMLGYYQVLLERALDAPRKPALQLPLLSGGDQQSWLMQSKNHDDIQVCHSPLPLNQSVIQWFEQQAADHPHRAAITHNRSVITYGVLNQRANKMARVLAENGIGDDHLVGIYLPRHFDMVIAVLATFKAGAAYVPLDHNYPAERLAYMLEDAGLELLITRREHKGELPPFSGKTLMLDRDANQLRNQKVLPLQRKAGVNDLAYVVYTSGSTGQPKGIAVNHITLTNFIGWHLATTSLVVGGKTLQYAPLSFDVSNQEIFATLCAGGILALVGEQVRHDPAQLWELLVRQRVSRLFLPPAALEPLVLYADGHDKKSAPALREIWVGGEQLKIDDHWKSFFRRNASCRLFNYYGPSECHAVTAYRLPRQCGSLAHPTSHRQGVLQYSNLYPGS